MTALISGLMKLASLKSRINIDKIEQTNQCVRAKNVWELLIRKVPKGHSLSIRHYGIGINDSKSILMVKAEVLKYLMHFRELQPDQIINRSIAYLKLVNKQDRILSQL